MGIWFAPGSNNNLTDMIQRIPDWASAFARMTTLKIEAVEAIKTSPPGSTINTWDSLIKAGLVPTLMSKGKSLACDVDAIRPWSIQKPGQAIALTRQVMSDIYSQGGTVTLSLDESFDQALVLGLTINEAIARVAAWAYAVLKYIPTAARGIGLCETYPERLAPVGILEAILDGLVNQYGIPIDHVHLDCNYVYAFNHPTANGFDKDVNDLLAITRRYNARFGVIIWGGGGNTGVTPASFCNNALTFYQRVKTALGSSIYLPTTDLIFETWNSVAGVQVPQWGPENVTNTLSWLMNQCT